MFARSVTNSSGHVTKNSPSLLTVVHGPAVVDVFDDRLVCIASGGRLNHERTSRAVGVSAQAGPVAGTAVATSVLVASPLLVFTPLLPAANDVAHVVVDASSALTTPPDSV